MVLGIRRWCDSVPRWRCGTETNNKARHRWGLDDGERATRATADNSGELRGWRGAEESTGSDDVNEWAQQLWVVTAQRIGLRETSKLRRRRRDERRRCDGGEQRRTVAQRAWCGLARHDESRGRLRSWLYREREGRGRVGQGVHDGVVGLQMSSMRRLPKREIMGGGRNGAETVELKLH